MKYKGNIATRGVHVVIVVTVVTVVTPPLYRPAAVPVLRTLWACCWTVLTVHHRGNMAKYRRREPRICWSKMDNNGANVVLKSADIF